MRRFFVAGALPQLEFGSKPDISARLLLDLFEDNLSAREMRSIKTLRLWIDLHNIYGLLEGGRPFDPRGNFSKSVLKTFLKDEEELPSYVFTFFNTFESSKDQIKHFSWLLAHFFAEEKKKATGFLKEFLEFEHGLHIVLTGWRAKRLGRDIATELQFEDDDDPIVRMALLQANSSGNFVFPFEYQELEELLKEIGKDPTMQYEVIAQYRFNFYSKYMLDRPFYMAAFAGYMMMLWILEEMFALKEDEGTVIAEQLIEKHHVIEKHHG